MVTDMLEKVDQVSRAGNATNVQQLKLQHSEAGSFGQLLRKEAEQGNGVHFSKHAAQRVRERGIEMTDSLLTNLNQAVKKAKEKGSRDVVVIGESGAFIVNVPHNIVVTTMSGAEMKENIFTNIDSAVLM